MAGDEMVSTAKENIFPSFHPRSGETSPPYLLEKSAAAASPLPAGDNADTSFLLFRFRSWCEPLSQNEKTQERIGQENERKKKRKGRRGQKKRRMSPEEAIILWLFLSVDFPSWRALVSYFLRFSPAYLRDDK